MSDRGGQGGLVDMRLGLWSRDREVFVVFTASRLSW